MSEAIVQARLSRSVGAYGEPVPAETLELWERLHGILIAQQQYYDALLKEHSNCGFCVDDQDCSLARALETANTTTLTAQDIFGGICRCEETACRCPVFQKPRITVLRAWQPGRAARKQRPR